MPSITAQQKKKTDWHKICYRFALKS